jgi:hypothetical protein
MFYHGRLPLLVLASMMFMRVWTANDRTGTPRIGAADRLKSRQQAAASAQARAETAVQETVAGPVSVQGAFIQQWTESDAPFVLPRGIAAGEFSVVDDTGRVGRLAIRGAQNAAAADQGQRNDEFHVIADSGRRWYLVRLKAAAIASQPAAPRVPNRKFDFSGY